MHHKQVIKRLLERLIQQIFRIKSFSAPILIQLSFMSDKNKTLIFKNPIQSLKIFTNVEGNKSMLSRQGQKGTCMFLKSLQDSRSSLLAFHRTS